MAESSKKADVSYILDLATELADAGELEASRLGNEAGWDIAHLREALREARAREEQDGEEANRLEGLSLESQRRKAPKLRATEKRWHNIGDAITASVGLAIDRQARAAPKKPGSVADVELALFRMVSDSGVVLEPAVIHRIAEEAMNTSRSSILDELRSQAIAEAAEEVAAEIRMQVAYIESACAAKIAAAQGKVKATEARLAQREESMVAEMVVRVDEMVAAEREALKRKETALNARVRKREGDLPRREEALRAELAQQTVEREQFSVDRTQFEKQRTQLATEAEALQQRRRDVDAAMVRQTAPASILRAEEQDRVLSDVLHEVETHLEPQRRIPQPVISSSRVVAFKETITQGRDAARQKAARLAKELRRAEGS